MIGAGVAMLPDWLLQPLDLRMVPLFSSLRATTAGEHARTACVASDPSRLSRRPFCATAWLPRGGEHGPRRRERQGLCSSALCLLLCVVGATSAIRPIGPAAARVVDSVVPPRSWVTRLPVAWAVNQTNNWNMFCCEHNPASYWSANPPLLPPPELCAN